MKIPKTVNIIGKSYTVLNEEPIPPDGEYGECDFRHTTLKVSPKQALDGQVDTLLARSHARSCGGNAAPDV